MSTSVTIQATINRPHGERLLMGDVSPGEPKIGALTCANLFVDCGGLPFGLEWSGFRRAAATEVSLDTALSCYHNLICRAESSGYPWSELIKSDGLQVASGLIVSNIVKRLNDFVSSCQLTSTNLGLVVAGSSCQRISVAGSRDPSDLRNTLINYVIYKSHCYSPAKSCADGIRDGE